MTVFPGSRHMAVFQEIVLLELLPILPAVPLSHAPPFQFSRTKYMKWPFCVLRSPYFANSARISCTKYEFGGESCTSCGAILPHPHSFTPIPRPFPICGSCPYVHWTPSVREGQFVCSFTHMFSLQPAVY